MTEIMRVAEIQAKFESEWVLIDDPETDESLEVKGGKVLWHSKDRDEVYRKATGKLEIMPLCGRIVPELEGYGFREVIYRNYRIVYRLTDDDTIEILAVVHGAREIKKVFHEEWELG